MREWKENEGKGGCHGKSISQTFNIDLDVFDAASNVAHFKVGRFADSRWRQWLSADNNAIRIGEDCCRKRWSYNHTHISFC